MNSRQNHFLRNQRSKYCEMRARHKNFQHIKVSLCCLFCGHEWEELLLLGQPLPDCIHCGYPTTRIVLNEDGTLKERQREDDNQTA